MPNAELTIPVRLIVTVAVGIATIALFFGATLVVLGQTGHLTYASGMTAFIACCTVAIAVSVLGVVGPFRSYITGGNRHRFLTVATWTSILLPFASMAEFAMFSFEGYWWFAVPAQTLAAGLLGVVVL